MHRIDRDTSGVVLFAKTPQAQRALKEQFAHREPERVYMAIVHGHPARAGRDLARSPGVGRGRRRANRRPPGAAGRRRGDHALPGDRAARRCVGAGGPTRNGEAQPDPGAGCRSRPPALGRASVRSGAGAGGHLECATGPACGPADAPPSGRRTNAPLRSPVARGSAGAASEAPAAVGDERQGRAARPVGADPSAMMESHPAHDSRRVPSCRFAVSSRCVFHVRLVLILGFLAPFAACGGGSSPAVAHARRALLRRPI